MGGHAGIHQVRGRAVALARGERRGFAKMPHQRLVVRDQLFEHALGAAHGILFGQARLANHVGDRHRRQFAQRANAFGDRVDRFEKVQVLGFGQLVQRLEKRAHHVPVIALRLDQQNHAVTQNAGQRVGDPSVAVNAGLGGFGLRFDRQRLLRHGNSPFVGDCTHLAVTARFFKYFHMVRLRMRQQPRALRRLPKCRLAGKYRH